MNTNGQDTQPMTLSELDADAEDWRDGWPTERIARTRTGARHSWRWSAVAPWVLLTVLGGAALTGGAWFALTANENPGPAGVTTGAPGPAPVNPVPAQGGVIVIPANRTSRTAARPAVARTSPAPTSTAQSTKPAAPPTAARTTHAAAADSAPSTAPATDTRSTSSSPTTTTPSAPAAPVPVSTAPDPSNPDCAVVTYSDGSTKDVCSPPAPATSGAGTGSPS